MQLHLCAMDPFHEIINLSDEDGYDSDGSSYNLERDFLLHNDEIQNDVEAMNIAQIHETTPSGIRNPLDSYQSCLKEIVEVFPDISHDHVQQIYNQHMGVPILNQRQEGRVAPTLIEKILDGGNYPKERDRIRELKRKRSDKDADEEEAAKWKYLDLRDGPTEYAKVAYVISLVLLASCVFQVEHINTYFPQIAHIRNNNDNCCYRLALIDLHVANVSSTGGSHYKKRSSASP